MNDHVKKARRALGRLDAEVREHPRAASAVLVRCDPRDLRAVKARLMREGFSPQPRSDLRGVVDEPSDWHVFMASGGSRNGPPRNSRELTRDVQKGELDFS